MYRYEGFEYTLDEVTQAAKDKNLTVDEYVNEYGLEQTSTDPTDPPVKGKTNDTVETGAPAVSETGQAPESTESNSEESFLVPPSKFVEKGKYVKTREGVEYAEKGSIVLAEPKEGMLAPVMLPEVVLTAEQYKEKQQQEENEAARKLMLQVTGLQEPTQEEIAVQKAKEGEISPITEFEETQRISAGEMEFRKQKQERAARVAAGEEDLSFGQATFATLINGLEGLRSLGSQAEYLYHFAGTTGYDFNANMFGKEYADKVYKENLVGMGNAMAKIDESNSMMLPTQAFYNVGKKEGVLNKIGGGIAAGLDGVGSLLTSVVSTPVGLGVRIFSNSIKNFNDTKANELGISVEELFNTGQAEYVVPAGLAGIELLSEKARIKGIGNYINSLPTSSKKQMYDLLSVVGTNFFQEWFQGGIGEVNTNLAKGMDLDEAGLAAGKFMMSKEGLEQGFKGMFGALGASVGGKYLTASHAVRTTTENQRIQNSLNELTTLEKAKSRNNITVQELETINTSQQEIISNLKNQFDENDVLVSALSEDQINKIAENSEFLTESVSRINEVNASQDFSKEEKDIMVKSIEQARNRAQQEIYDIRNEGEILVNNIRKAKEAGKYVSDLDFQDFANKEEIDNFLKEQGLDKDLDAKASEQQGFVIQNPETGKQTIIINREVAAREKAMNIAGHELGHVILYKTVKDNPENAISLGNALLNELNKIDAAKIADSNFKKRMERYADQDVDIQMEEALTLFSDALATGDIKFEENVFTKLGDRVRRTLQRFGVKIKFNTGRDVYNFIKDYNKSIEKGDLSLAQVEAAAKGVKGKLVEEAKVKSDEQIVKESRSEEASQKVQQIYEEQGEAGAFDIIEQFKPIVSKLVDKRREAPGFDRQLLTDEIETGDRGLFDLIREYNPDSGVPLAAYINKYLPARAIEASKRVLGEEFVEDVTEAKGVVTEEAVTEVETKPKREVRKPSESTQYSNTILNNAKVESKAQLEDKITKATQDAFKDQEITRFGETRNIPESVAEIYGEAFGINPQTFVDKKRNYQKYDAEGLTRAKQFLVDNASADYARLPKTKDDFGKGTFIPNNVLNVMYTDGQLTGTLKDYIDLIKEKPTKPIYRDKVGQTIRGLMGLHIRNRMLENLIPVKAERLRAGAKFSQSQKKETNEFIENQTFEKTAEELAAENKVWKFISKKLGLDFIDSKNPENVQEMRDWVVNELAPRLPKSFFTQGTLANAGISAAKRGFFFTSIDDINTALENAAFANEDLDIASAVTRKTYVTGGAQGNISKNFLNEFNSDKFKKEQDAKLNGLKKIFKTFETMIQEDNQNAKYIIALLGSTSQGMGHFVRTSAPIKFYSKNLEGGIVEEHTMPASLVAKYLFKAAINGTVDADFKNIQNNYFQGALGKIDDKKLKGKKPDGKPFNYTAMTPEGWKVTDNIWARYFNINVATNDFGIDPNNIVLSNGKTVFETYGINSAGHKVSVEMNKSEQKAAEKNNNTLVSTQKVKLSKSNPSVLPVMSNIDKAMDNARKIDAPIKKIRVFDFDDTLARSKSQVIYEMPDGTTGKLNATQFAERAAELQAQGAEFDFSEFSKVIEGKKGPLFEVAKKINEARGNEDLYILTARPADAAGPIYEFMKANGIEFKQENIIGLGDGTAAAKGRWITSKAAEGYNDFYFADDAIKNVKAVKDALSVFDVKSKVQQAKVKFSKNIDAEFNKILEDKSGIAAEKEYSKAKAEVVGKKLRLPRFIPYSAQDFAGLLYSTLSKGKKGEQQLQWYEETLFKPFSRAMTNLDRARVAMANDYKALKKGLGIVPKNLRKKIPGEVFTNEQAVRVYIWNKQGMEIPGISKTDLKDLTKHVIDNSELQVFADQLIAIQKGREYAKPGEGWLGGTITTDLLEGLNTGRRAEYLQEWQANADIVFSEKNLNKLEAIYGKKYRKAIENSLRRMKTGRNKNYSDDSLTARFTDWLNGSIGVTMFLNTRSAVLQTLSATNFVNFSDNNPYKAGKAFANQPQYWKDFMYLFNSDFLKSRRGGLRMDVTESDIADMAKKGGPKAVVGKILQFGFTPTQMADSFAIASGGATFYRNRINTYKKQGLSQAEAEAKAFEDFRDTAEISQQSSRPDLISQQQAGPLGRPILAYSNTPAQYTRIMDKAVRDLVAGRGDAKTHISKIIYYATAQNLIFNALQQGLFAFAFGDEEPEEEEKVEKYVDVANGMADSVLRGTGLGGAAISVGKNAILRIMREMEKDQPKLEKVGYELTKISPPVSSKLSKINQAARAYQWDKDEMMEKGLSLDNPAYLAGANVIAATTNIPLDRAIKKVNNVIQSTESDLETWERLALLGGWQDWQIGIEEEEKEKAKKPKPKTTRRKTVKRRTITR